VLYFELGDFVEKKKEYDDHPLCKCRLALSGNHRNSSTEVGLDVLVQPVRHRGTNNSQYMIDLYIKYGPSTVLHVIIWGLSNPKP
jgi:hypothetical protein